MKTNVDLPPEPKNSTFLKNFSSFWIGQSMGDGRDKAGRRQSRVEQCANVERFDWSKFSESGNRLDGAD